MIALPRYWRLIVEGSVALALLLALWACDRSRDKYRDQLSKANAVIESMVADGERRKAEVSAAREWGVQHQAEAKVKADAVRVTPANGCPTPKAVLEADL